MRGFPSPWEGRADCALLPRNGARVLLRQVSVLPSLMQPSLDSFTRFMSHGLLAWAEAAGHPDQSSTPLGPGESPPRAQGRPTPRKLLMEILAPSHGNFEPLPCPDHSNDGDALQESGGDHSWTCAYGADRRLHQGRGRWRAANVLTLAFTHSLKSGIGGGGRCTQTVEATKSLHLEKCSPARASRPPNGLELRSMVPKLQSLKCRILGSVKGARN